MGLKGGIDIFDWKSQRITPELFKNTLRPPFTLRTFSKKRMRENKPFWGCKHLRGAIECGVSGEYFHRADELNLKRSAP